MEIHIIGTMVSTDDHEVCIGLSWVHTSLWQIKVYTKGWSCLLQKVCLYTELLI